MNVRKEFPLNSFYREYSDDPMQFESLLKMYDNVWKDLDSIVNQVKRNYIFTTSETYRVIPFQILKLEDSVYSISEIVSTDFAVKSLGLYNQPIQERVYSWINDFTREQKLNVLDATLNFISLSAGRSEIIDKKFYQIKDLSIMDVQGKPFKEGIDYVLKDNRIYLFGDLSSKDKSYEVILKDIVIDYKTPEAIMGKNFPIMQPGFLVPNEYRELMQIFTHAALGGPVLKKLNDAFNSVPGLTGFEIMDKVSARGSTKETLWAQNEFLEPHKLNRNEFILATPFDVFFDQDKLKIIRSFIEKIKPTTTSMIAVPTMSKIEDKYLLNIQAKEVAATKIIRKQDGMFKDLLFTGNMAKHEGYRFSSKNTFKERIGSPGRVIRFDSLNNYDSMISDYDFESYASKMIDYDEGNNYDSNMNSYDYYGAIDGVSEEIEFKFLKKPTSTKNYFRDKLILSGRSLSFDSVNRFDSELSEFDLVSTANELNSSDSYNPLMQYDQSKVSLGEEIEFRIIKKQ